MKRYLTPLAGYALLTALMTWPTLAQFSTAIPGDGFDGWQNYWNLWWIKESLLVQRTHPFFTTLLYPPRGVSLLFHTLNFFNGLWSLPLQLNANLAVAYNAVVLFHFTLSGFGAYLLALYTITRLDFSGQAARWAAFAGGLVFTFSPFHMAHLLGHMQVFSLTWPPFYALWLLRTLDAWRLDGHLSRRNLGLSGLFLLLAATVDWYQALYLILFTGLALAWTLWRARRERQVKARALLKPALGVLGMGLVFGLVLSPLILPMAREALSADYMKPGFEENVILSADLLAFATPSELHPLWGRWAGAIYERYTATTSERLVFAGFGPLLLAALTLVRQRRRLIRFWLIATGFFGVMSLGPYLHVAGQVVRWGQSPLPMPYLLLYKTIPFIGISRSLSRFDMMVMMGLGVLAAAGAATLLQRLRGRTRQVSYLLLPALICFEFIAIPYPMSQIDTPPFYAQLARESGDFTVANLPMNWDRPTPLLYQTTHGKRLLTAYTSRGNPLESAWRVPILQHWRYLDRDIIQADLAAIAPTVLDDFKLRYVVLDYYQMPPGPERDGTEMFLAEALPGLTPVYDDGRLKVYAPPRPAAPVPYLSLGDGWGPRQTVHDRLQRAVQGNATANIHHGQGLAPTLSIEAFSPRPQNLEILIDGVAVGTIRLDRAPGSHQIPLPALAANPVAVTLKIQDPLSPAFVSRLALVAQMSDQSGQHR
ncbi:MAG: hypothetical protein ACE5H9_12315 [Anaerolineae bacterium]